MRYQLGLRDDGWVVVDPDSRAICAFGGLQLFGLTVEEAHVMMDLLQAYDRGLVAEADDAGTVLLAEA